MQHLAEPFPPRAAQLRPVDDIEFVQPRNTSLAPSGEPT
jgi:hypothetical protein